MGLYYPSDAIDLRKDLPAGVSGAHQAIILVSPAMPETHSLAHAVSLEMDRPGRRQFRASVVLLPGQWASFRHAFALLREPIPWRSRIRRYYDNLPTTGELVGEIRKANPNTPIILVDATVMPSGSKPSSPAIKFFADQPTKPRRKSGIAKAPAGLDIPPGVILAKIRMPRPVIPRLPEKSAEIQVLNTEIGRIFRGNFRAKLEAVLDEIARKP